MELEIGMDTLKPQLEAIDTTMGLAWPAMELGPILYQWLLRQRCMARLLRYDIARWMSDTSHTLTTELIKKASDDFPLIGRDGVVWMVNGLHHAILVRRKLLTLAL
jgi:hypothetical protein